MADFSSLIATINANIKTNGNQEITGSVLNSVLNAIVNAINNYKSDNVSVSNNSISGGDLLARINVGGVDKDIYSGILSKMLLKHYPCTEIVENKYERDDGVSFDSANFFIVKGCLVKGCSNLIISRPGTSSDSIGVTFWTEGGQFISGKALYAADIHNLPIPENAYSAHVSFSRTRYNSLDSFVFYPYTDMAIIDDLSDKFDIPFSWIDGKFIYSPNGTALNFQNYSITDFVNVEAFDRIKLYIGSKSNNVGFAFYASNNESSFVSGINSNDYNIGDIVTFDVPASAKYFRATCDTTNKSKFFLSLVSVSGSLLRISQSFDGVRDEISETKMSIEDIKKIPLGELVNGFVNVWGQLQEATSYKRTGFVPIYAKQLKHVVTANVANVGMAFYDDSKAFISGQDFSGHAYGDVVIVDVPVNAKYFVTCAINAQASNMKEEIVEIGGLFGNIVHDTGNPCFYRETEECRVFRKILCIGDSLTEGAFDYKEDGVTKEMVVPSLSYPGQLASITGRETTNAGDSGESTKTWWELHQNDDLSGHDACIIALGRNDYATGRETTSEERILYMTNIVNKVKADNPQIKIFISTLINYYTGTDADAVNADMRTIASTLPDCYLVDISAYGKLVRYLDNYSHCTAVGYFTLAEYYFHYISYIMRQNRADFQNIQFAGTNRSYS